MGDLKKHMPDTEAIENDVNYQARKIVPRAKTVIKKIGKAARKKWATITKGETNTRKAATMAEIGTFDQSEIGFTMVLLLHKRTKLLSIDFTRGRCVGLFQSK